MLQRMRTWPCRAMKAEVLPGMRFSFGYSIVGSRMLWWGFSDAIGLKPSTCTPACGHFIKG